MATLEEALKARGRSRRTFLPALLVVAVILLAAFIVHQVFLPPSSPTASVSTVTAQLGSVTAAVSGTGNVAPVNSSSVNFAVGGTISEVDASVGSQVQAGQVLAKLDTSQLQLAVTEAQNSLAAAQQQLSATQTSISNDQAQLSQDETKLTSDTNQLHSDQNQYNVDWTAYNANSLYQIDAYDLRQAQAAYNAELSLAAADGCTTDPSSSTCQSLQSTLSADATQVSKDQQQVNSDLATVNADLQKISSDQSLVSADQSKVTADQLRVDQDSTLNQQNQVLNAQQALSTAQSNLTEATLTSPISGVVLAVNATVGEQVGSSGSSGQSGASAAAGTTSSALFQIGDLTSLEVVAPFAETDASKVKVGQKASVTFDAVTGLTIPAAVTQVSPVSTVTSNVVNYNVTVLLTGTDPRLKDGMTSTVAVTVVDATGVLEVPNSAITSIGANSFVTVLAANGKTQTRTAVQLGVAGDSTTQVLSGIQPGARLVLPTLSVSSTTRSALGGGLGGGGLGGGGFGGGAGFVGRSGG